MEYVIQQKYLQLKRFMSSNEISKKKLFSITYFHFAEFSSETMHIVAISEKCTIVNKDIEIMWF